MRGGRQPAAGPPSGPSVTSGGEPASTGQEAESREGSKAWRKVARLGSCRAGLASDSHRVSRAATAFPETRWPVHARSSRLAAAGGPERAAGAARPLVPADGNYETPAHTPELCPGRQPPPHPPDTGPGAAPAPPRQGLPVSLSETQTAWPGIHGPFRIPQARGGTRGVHGKGRTGGLGCRLTCGVRPGRSPDLARCFPGPKPGHAHGAHPPAGLAATTRGPPAREGAGPACMELKVAGRPNAAATLLVQDSLQQPAPGGCGAAPVCRNDAEAQRLSDLPEVTHLGRDPNRGASTVFTRKQFAGWGQSLPLFRPQFLLMFKEEMFQTR